MLRRIMLIIAIATVAVVPITGAADAKGKRAKRAATKMSFAIEDKTLDLGEAAQGTVTVKTRSKTSWVALADAEVAVYLDGELVDGVTTNDDGQAAVTATPQEAGEHTIRVVYAGDSTHKKAKRSQGVEVAEAADDVDDVEDVEDVEEEG